VRRVFAVAGALALALVSGATAAGPTLKSLESQRRAAILDLYALESKTSAAARRLYELQQQQTALRVKQALLQQELLATHTTLVRSRSHLAENLRNLYKRGNVNALAVVLGSQSLDDAMTQLDTLDAVTSQSEEYVSATQHAQTRLGRLRTTLAKERAELDSAVAAARRTLASLAAARAEHAAFIARLRTQERLKTAAIAALETRVHHAQVKSAQLTQAQAPAAQAPAQEEEPAAASAGGRQLTVSSTGYALPGRTATGLPVGWGVVAVDPSVIPLGTKMTIPGYGEGVAADTGSAVRGNDIDLWFPSLAQARAWGRRTVTITLH
jgi:3D (Asp-Asp-Asp) domain-containing protein